jgi:hypothetical protein
VFKPWLVLAGTQMSVGNPLWRAPRIHDEPPNLGFEVTQPHYWM